MPTPLEKLYEWANSAEGKALQQKDPVAFANHLRYEHERIDGRGFVDGNSRISRMMADLVMLKAGLSPAAYTTTKVFVDRIPAQGPSGGAGESFSPRTLKVLVEHGHHVLKAYFPEAEQR